MSGIPENLGTPDHFREKKMLRTRPFDL